MRFTRRPRGLEAKVDALEARLLSGLAGDLLELLGPSQPPGSDPLAAMVGIAGGAVATPEDPALARLLPDAYSGDDDASSEFRRYTEADLRAGKRAHATDVRQSLEAVIEQGGRVRLDRPLADAWLGLLNDLRLVLASRLGVTEQTELDPADDAPLAPDLHVYGWLGHVQESLLAQLAKRPFG